MSRQWLIDGNNVFGSRPDGWWNDRGGAMQRFAQCVAEWCRTHDDLVVLVFDAPVPDAALDLAGGNLTIEQAARRGRNAADDRIVDLAADREPAESDRLVVVTSDRGLRARLDDTAEVVGVGQFRTLVEY